jgi:hypothetical protein
MDIKTKYNELFYKTCVMIDLIEEFEIFLKDNLVNSREILYDAHFRAITDFKDRLVNFANEQIYLP